MDVIKHNLKKMGCAELMPFFEPFIREKKIDLDILRTLTPMAMGVVFRHDQKALFQFEQAFQKMRQDDWEVPTMEEELEQEEEDFVLKAVKCEMPFEETEDSDYNDTLLSNQRLVSLPVSVEESSIKLELSNLGSPSRSPSPRTSRRASPISDQATESRKLLTKRSLDANSEGPSIRSKCSRLDAEEPNRSGQPNVIETALKKHLEGTVLFKAGKQGQLDNSDRRSICHHIIYSELGDDINARISEEKLENLAEIIEKTFPKEHAHLYYVPRTEKNGRKRACSPRGILYVKYQEVLKFLQKHDGEKRSRRLPARHARQDRSDEDKDTVSSAPTDESDMDWSEVSSASTDESDLDWLEQNQGSKEITVEKWGRTSEFRKDPVHSELHLTLSQINEYFNQFECLKQPWGLKLLLSDFNSWFADKSIDIVDQWLPISKSLRDLLKFRNRYNEEEAATFDPDVYLLQSIPKVVKQALLVGPRPEKSGEKRKFWKPSQDDSRKGFFLHVETLDLLESEIDAMKTKCKEVNRDLQPFPAVVGHRDNQQCYVVVGDLKYTVDSPLIAFDSCFKLYHALHAQYPVQSSYSWMFAEKALYQMTTDSDLVIPLVVSAMSHFNSFHRKNIKTLQVV